MASSSPGLRAIVALTLLTASVLVSTRAGAQECYESAEQARADFLAHQQHWAVEMQLDPAGVLRLDSRTAIATGGGIAIHYPVWWTTPEGKAPVVRGIEPFAQAFGLFTLGHLGDPKGNPAAIGGVVAVPVWIRAFAVGPRFSTVYTMTNAAGADQPENVARYSGGIWAGFEPSEVTRLSAHYSPIGGDVRTMGVALDILDRSSRTGSFGFRLYFDKIPGRQGAAFEEDVVGGLSVIFRM